MNKNTAQRFIWFAAAVLLLTAIAKFISVGGTVRILDQPDPLFKIKYRQLLLGVGTLETCVAVVLLAYKPVFTRLALIAWLSTNFLLYRIGIWWINPPQPCGCLGTITSALGITPKTGDHLMLGVLIVLLVGSFSLLALEWKKKKGDSSGGSLMDSNTPESAA